VFFYTERKANGPAPPEEKDRQEIEAQKTPRIFQGVVQDLFVD
jgi:hypothetical protein